jgi:hypothetical protein
MYGGRGGSGFPTLVHLPEAIQPLVHQGHDQGVVLLAAHLLFCRQCSKRGEIALTILCEQTFLTPNLDKNTPHEIVWTGGRDS